MGATDCAVPGCQRKKYKSRNGRFPSLFTVLCPELAKNVAERNHRQRLTDFVLLKRNVGENDFVIDLLKRGR